MRPLRLLKKRSAPTELEKLKMSRRIGTAVSVGLLLATAGGLMAAQEKRASPHEDVTATVSGKKITISYGRPSKKGREIFGALVPWDQVWRTGADEATTLTTEADLTIGTLQVPKGTYTLFTVPKQKEWTLVVNKVAKQWGAYTYDQKQDLGRTPMAVTTNPKLVEQLTLTMEAQGEKKVVLKAAWDTTAASVPITVR